MDINVNTLFNKYLPKLSKEFQQNDYSLKKFQKLVVANVLAQKNTLGIMPTGGGKSLIYWLSGLSTDGITIVISPLIALIDEQANKIKEQGYEVMTIHGGLSAKKQISILQKFYHKELNPNFIFVSPERIATDGFFEFCIKSRREEIKLLTIDEIHCVSQWGFDFRPFYKRIPNFLAQVFKNEPPVVLGLTATINPNEVNDICKDFNINRSNVLKDDLLIRGEIELVALKFANEEQKEEKLWLLLSIHKNEKTLVYLYRKYKKRGVEKLADEANKKGYKAKHFHGDLSANERQKIITKYKNNEINVIFATNAFGMGIDIPDIRVIIHFMIPESVEQYYQEIGRAARDGEAGRAYIMYSNKNISVRKTHFIDKSFPNVEHLHKSYKNISSNKIGLKTVQYFQDDSIQRCFPYYLDNEILKIEGKGITNLKIFSSVEDTKLSVLINSTKTQSIISTLKKNKISVAELLDLVYSNIATGGATLINGLDKCLIVNNLIKEIGEEKVNQILLNIKEKKNYKYGLLDYFTYLLNGYNSSKELHQEIGLYLGVDKHILSKIYKTLKGDLVRSKSEVIISNILFNEGINYEYEQKLFYSSTKWIEPDFTVRINGRIFFWEHLGMIGIESYDKRWVKKLAVYEKYFPNQLKITYESAILSNSTSDLIQELKFA